MSAGYSGTSLIKKLGLAPGMKAAFPGAPDHYRTLLGELPEDLRILTRLGREMDFIHFFTHRRAELLRRLPALKKALAPAGMLWISWPRKTSRLEKDLAEGNVRAARLASGLVDGKICAVDDDWSGLKFVYRLRDRG